MAKTVALIGAAGAMGTRISNALRDVSDYKVLYVETPTGEARVRERGDTPTPRDAAVRDADIVVLAVPDHRVGFVANEILIHLRPGTIVICLDPAAPYAGALPKRSDITYFVTHPAHPPIFNDETDEEARRDYWGGGKAKQSIVNALVAGPEEHYHVGEAFARCIFRPILRSHRVTVEQMAMLEPALSESVAATCITVMREAMDEAIRRGVPAEAARDFLLGHITTELAIVFNEIDWEFSAGAKKAIEQAKQILFRPDWKQVFFEDRLRASVAQIVYGERADVAIDSKALTYGYSPVVAQLTRLGQPASRVQWLDYRALGLSEENTPELLRMLRDEQWNAFEKERPEWFTPTHVQRALGQFRATEAIPAIIERLRRSDDADTADDPGVDAAKALAMIGPESQTGLIGLLTDPLMRSDLPKSQAGNALVYLSREHPETRDASVAALVSVLENYAANSKDLNASIVGNLAELGAVEALPLIRRAFDAGRVNEDVCASYEAVERDMRHPDLNRYQLLGEWGTEQPTARPVVSDTLLLSSSARTERQSEPSTASRNRNRKREHR